LFNPRDFRLRFADGISVNAYDIIRLGPLSGSPLYKGDVRGIEEYKTILILYQKNDQKLAIKLLEDLRKGLQDNKKIFPGFNQALRTSLDIDIIPFNNFDPNEIYDTYIHHASSNAFPVIILPRYSRSIYDSIYYRTKAVFLSKDIPSQVVTRDLILDEPRYRWSLLSISIQIYTKMGGVPYALDRSMIRAVDLSDTAIIIMGLGISAHPLYRKRGVGFVTVFDHNGVWNFMDSQALSMDRTEDISEKIATLLERSVNKVLSVSTKKNNILIIHYSGKEISSREEEALRRAIKNAKYLDKFTAVYILKIRDSDIVIASQSSPHIAKDGTCTWYPPVGACFKLKPDVYAMVTTGYFNLGDGKNTIIKSNILIGLPTIKIIARHRDIEPRTQEFDISDIDLLSTVFGMSRLNYVAINNPVTKEPITIRYSREIAWISLRLIENNVDISKLSRARYVMWFL